MESMESVRVNTMVLSMTPGGLFIVHPRLSASVRSELL